VFAFLILIAVATLVGTIYGVYLDPAGHPATMGCLGVVGRAQEVQVMGTRTDFEPIVTSR
jgi:hypothetical protein